MDDYKKIIDSCQEGDINNIISCLSVVKNNLKITLNRGLDIACEKQLLDIVVLLINHGADDFNTGLTTCCIRGNMKIIQFLIEKADENYPFNWNLGLNYACYSNNIEIVQLMIDKGANNLKDCLAFSNETIKKLLINKGHTVP